MKKELGIVVLTFVLTLFFVRAFFPRTKIITNTVPQIVTRYDTVESLPKWYADSLKKWKKTIHTTDTVNIYVTNTIVRTLRDTMFVNVGPDTTQRSKIWPIIAYHSGSHFGDSAVVSTFNLRSGIGSISKLFVPGILIAMDADSVNSYPKLTFAPFPPPKKISLFTKIVYIGGGYGACSLVHMVK